MNLGGMRSGGVSVDYMMSAILDAPAFIVVLLKMWEEFYDMLPDSAEFLWAFARQGQLAVIATKPLAKAVNILARSGQGSKSTFALAEIVWDSWTVMGEPAFRLIAAHVNYKEAKEDWKLCDFMQEIGKGIWDDSDDAWVEDVNWRAWASTCDCYASMGT